MNLHCFACRLMYSVAHEMAYLLSYGFVKIAIFIYVIFVHSRKLCIMLGQRVADHFGEILGVKKVKPLNEDYSIGFLGEFPLIR